MIENKDTCVFETAILNAVSDNKDIAVIEKLISMRDEKISRESKILYNTAFTKMQFELPEIKKTKERRVIFKDRKGEMVTHYAPLGDIVKQIKKALCDNGFAYSFNYDTSTNRISVTCKLTHSAGYSELSTMVGSQDLSGNKNELNAIASTTTYLSRYTLCAVLGICTADEDMDGRLPDEYNTISDEEAKEIESKIAAYGIDFNKFMAHCGVGRVGDIKSKNLPYVLSALNKKIVALSASKNENS